MGRKATGEVRWSGKLATTRIRTFDKRRETFELPHAKTEDEAEARSLLLADIAKRFRTANVHRGQAIEALRVIAAASPRSLKSAVKIAEELLGSGRILEDNTPTFREIGEEWTSGRLHERFPDYVKDKDADQDKRRLALLCEIDIDGTALGDIQITRFQLDHAERAMQALPARVKKSATRRHYAQVLSRVLGLAVYPLRHISVNPLPKGFMPKVGKPPRYPYLYPDEEAALLACSADKVPVHLRMLYGFLTREGCRASEAGTLAWRDLDLKRGTVKLDKNKTDDPRPWPLGHDVVRALAIWQRMTRGEAGDYVFAETPGVPVDTSKLAEQLRDDLAAAGVTRAELFAATENTGRLRAHDLRGTFTTLALANGRTETWVVDRTGWTSSAMIARYRRQARHVEELHLGWLYPLDEAIPELRLAPNMPQKTRGPLAESVDAGDLKSSAPKRASRFESGRGHPRNMLDSRSFSAGAEHGLGHLLGHLGGSR